MRPVHMKFSSFLAATLMFSPLFGALEFKDSKGKHLDVVSDGKILVRYMYEHDTSTPEKHHETYKPYLHVFDAEGKSRSRRAQVVSSLTTAGSLLAGAEQRQMGRATIAGT